MIHKPRPSVHSEFVLKAIYLEKRLLLVASGPSGESFQILDPIQTTLLLRRSLRLHRRIDDLVEKHEKKPIPKHLRQRFATYLQAFGAYLNDVILRNEVADLLNVAVGQAVRDDRYVLVRLMIGNDFLNIVPWELTSFDKTPICHSFDIVRHPFSLQPVRTPADEANTNLLFIAANPTHKEYATDQIDAVEAAITASDLKITSDQLTPGNSTITNIASKLYDGTDLLHFVAHGEIDSEESPAQGYLLVDGEKPGTTGKITVRMLESFCRVRPMSVAVLNACRSDQAFSYQHLDPAMIPFTNYFSMAHAMIQTGVPCVIGMSHKISKVGATILTRRLYRALLQQRAEVSTAVRQARLELFAHTSGEILPSDWMTPTLYSRRRILGTNSR